MAHLLMKGSLCIHHIYCDENIKLAEIESFAFRMMIYILVAYLPSRR